MTYSRYKICIVDDDLKVLSIMVKMLETIGCSSVESYPTIDPILCKKCDYDIIFLDLHIGNMEGTYAIEQVKKLNPLSSIVIVTGLSSSDLIIQAMRSGVVDVITKPFTIMDLEASLRRAIQRFDFLRSLSHREKLTESWKSRFQSLERSYSKLLSVFGNMNLDSYLELLVDLCGSDTLSCGLYIKDRSGCKHIAGSSLRKDKSKVFIEEPVLRDPNVNLIVLCNKGSNIDSNLVKIMSNLIRPVLLYNLKLMEVDNAIVSMVKSINSLMEARDTFTKSHSKRVTDHVIKFLSYYNIDIPDAKLTCMFHDVGKIGVPDNILLKPGSLSSRDKKQMQMHPIWGQKITEPLKQMGLKIDPLSIRHHHERWDGEGYPDGLKGEDIPFLARLICIADSHDAMVSMRVYRGSMDIESVKREIVNNAGKQFDPELAVRYVEYWWNTI